MRDDWGIVRNADRELIGAFRRLFTLQARTLTHVASTCDIDLARAFFEIHASRLKAHRHAVIAKLLRIRMHGINHLVINLRVEQGPKTICDKVDVGGRYVAEKFRKRQSPSFDIVLRRIGFRHLSIARQSPGLDRHDRRTNGQHRCLTEAQDHQSQRYQAIPTVFCL